jgi:hypothetical protein
MKPRPARKKNKTKTKKKQNGIERENTFQNTPKTHSRTVAGGTRSSQGAQLSGDFCPPAAPLIWLERFAGPFY